MVVVDRSVQAVLVPVSKLHPADWNPRLIRDVRFKNLCRSIEADPDFLWRRPILATSDGTVYGGNMRLRAVQHMGWTDVPAIVDDIPNHLAKERALKDNNAWGETQEQELAELLVELQESQVDLETLGFSDSYLNRLLDSVGALGDTPSYRPNTGPDIAILQVDADGVAGARHRLDHAMERQRDQESVMCPHCGGNFYLDR
jgi:hypothetical protein